MVNNNKIQILWFILLLFTCKGFSQKLPNTPNTYFSQKVNVVDATYFDSINNLLANLEDEYQIQFLVYVDSSLNGNNLEDYTNKLFNHWKLGKKGDDNGILLALFINDRKFRIEVGYGLEGKIPDLLANNIQEKYLVPELRAGNYGKGIFDCAKGLYDAATDYKDDLTGEKRRQYIDSLIISDKARILNDQNKLDLFYPNNRDYTMYLDSHEDIVSFCYTGNANSVEELKEQMDFQWSEIQKYFPYEKHKIFAGFSATKPIYFVFIDSKLKPYFTIPKAGNIGELPYYSNWFLETYNKKNYEYVFSTFFEEAQEVMEINSFKKSHPIYTAFFSRFYDVNDEYFCYNYWTAILFTSIAIAVLLPVLLINIFILFSSGVDRKVKAIVFVWSILNNLLIIVILGYLQNIILLINVIKIFRKKGDWQKKLDDIKKKGFFGNIIDAFSGSGGGGTTYSSGGGSYRSSGSSWGSSSSSSRSSSSSSSSSSSRSFSGGGGGRSGGGGSSGSW